MFEGLPQNHFAAIYADPPWRFEAWSKTGDSSHGVPDYPTMLASDIEAMPVRDLAAKDCCLFMWIVWPQLPEALKVIDGWGFKYKTCAFSWVKADAHLP